MGTLRPVDAEVDLDAIFAVAYACELATVVDPDTTREDIGNLIRSPDADLVYGTRVAVADDGTIVGFVSVEVDEPGREIRSDAYAPPELEDGTWDRLLQHAVAYAEERVAALPEVERAGWVLAGGAYASDAAYSGVLARAGMVPVRRFHSMAMTFDSSQPLKAPRPPTGSTLSVVGDDEQLMRAAHALWLDSFAGHWRFVPRPYDDFMTYSRSRSFDPTQWWIGFVEGKPAGLCVGDEHLAEVGWSYIGTLGVVEEFRGRGMGRLLLETFFAQAHERGRVGVKLGVDTENHTGAPALYTAVGMHAVQVIDAWERPLS